MDQSKAYDPSQVEDRWYQYWYDKGFFNSTPDEREPFTIVIPPPNVTGVLHMGHLLNDTIQDVLIRRARLLGYNACWVPGTDHASIATEAKVVEMLREKGIDKNDLSREEFLEYAWEWKEQYGGMILQQLKRIGASCDWSRTRFTMEDDLYKSVIKVFVDLHRKGYIYKGVQMVNWDPVAQTALSDEEVNYKEVDSKLYHVAYKLKDSDETINIATTRPETILADTAIAVNPNDERYQDLHGAKAFVPLINREVPIITDEYVDLEFGTGALKVTPAHDQNDYAIGQKHDLRVIDILNPDGTLNEEAHQFNGQDRFEAQKSIAKALEDQRQLIKTENITNKVGFSERTDSVIEPRLSDQWFCRMTEMAKPALENVLNDNIAFYPGKFKNSYKHWMENIRDWCISRQLWWGQRIPVYYLPDGNYVVAETEEEAVQLAKEKTGDSGLTASSLQQEEDVLDTWFSSWLWPISVFNGILEPDNEEINYYYPTNSLVTGPDILFFWVARMIMAGYEYRGQKPFDQVYFTGMVRDKNGRKMSKSLGNSPDILRLMDDYGADGTRFGVLISSPAGNDLLFDEKLCEQGRNFCNKIWNALRLVKSWESNGKIGEPDESETKQRYENSVELFRNKLREGAKAIEHYYDNFRISDIVTTLYRLFWDDFCSKYLEWIKPNAGEKLDAETYETTLQFFEELLKLLHPYMPFITEETWHQLRARNEDDCLIVARYQSMDKPDEKALEAFDQLSELNTAIRNFKTENEISPGKSIPVQVHASNPDFFTKYDSIITKAAGVSEIELVDEITDSNNTIVVGKDQLHFQLESVMDVEAQLKKLEEEKAYLEGFLEKAIKKLNNEGFVNNAKPEVVEKERQKKEDAEEKIRKLEENIERLKETRT